MSSFLDPARAQVSLGEGNSLGRSQTATCRDTEGRREDDFFLQALEDAEREGLSVCLLVVTSALMLLSGSRVWCWMQGAGSETTPFSLPVA